MTDDLDLVLDRLRGELPESEARALDARAERDPQLAASRRSLEAFLTAAYRDRVPEVSPADSSRLCHAVLAESRAKEESERRVARSSGGRRLVWARILAVSVAVHVVLIALLSLGGSDEPAPTDEGARFVASLPEPRFDPVAEESFDPGPWPTPETDRVAAIDIPTDDDPPGSAGTPDETSLASLEERRREHPPGLYEVVHPRFDDAVKRRLLERAGLDADRMLARIGLGLDAIRTRQQPDGSFLAGGGRGPTGETALAALPLLGDGESSGRTDGPDTVARAVAWLRRGLFAGNGTGPTLRDAGAVTTADLGIALKTLSEDYVLSYGRLAPKDAARRAREIGLLAGHIAARQETDGSFAAGGAAPEGSLWAMWGLDAAARSGAVIPPASTASRFREWFLERRQEGGGTREERELLPAMGVLFARYLAPAGGDPADRAVLASGLPAGAGALYPAAVGTGLYLQDPARYGDWSRIATPALESLLLPSGLARGEDPVGDTALVLLALQVAYRTY